MRDRIQFQLIDITKANRIQGVPEDRAVEASYAEYHAPDFSSIDATFAPDACESHDFSSSCWEAGVGIPPHKVEQILYGFDVVHEAMHQQVEARLAPQDDPQVNDPVVWAKPQDLTKPPKYGESAIASRDLKLAYERFQQLKLMEDAMAAYRLSRSQSPAEPQIVQDEHDVLECPHTGHKHCRRKAANWACTTTGIEQHPEKKQHEITEVYSLASEEPVATKVEKVLASTANPGVLQIYEFKTPDQIPEADDTKACEKKWKRFEVQNNGHWADGPAFTEGPYHTPAWVDYNYAYVPMVVAPPEQAQMDDYGYFRKKIFEAMTFPKAALEAN